VPQFELDGLNDLINPPATTPTKPPLVVETARRRRVTVLEQDPILDLDAWVGQRACTFRFFVTDAVTGRRIGEIHPIRGANLTHDTSQVIKRRLTLSLGTADTEAFNPVSDRISPVMVFAEGANHPLGRYMVTTPTLNRYTSGRLASLQLSDEMFIIDQQIRKGVDGSKFGSIGDVVKSLVSGLSITYNIEASPFHSVDAWPIGTTRGQILEALATSGDYFSPWFGNDSQFHMIRTFNPAKRLIDIDLDSGFRVLRNGITEESDLLTAPNVIVVVSNNSTNSDTPVVGTARVPESAPNSVSNRGFEIPQIINLQVSSAGQAQAMARGISVKNAVAQRVTLTTPPDPRHDSYNVIRWDNDNWLELSWSMQLTEGGTMTHLLRKAYT
jgi:hypothetical protein